MDKEHKANERFIDALYRIIRWAVKVLAILMVFVIIMGVVDVLWVIYKKLTSPPFMLLQISDILATFGAFMAVLIAIEIFENITIYLKDDIIHVKIVMATALMAIARKVIILDFADTPPAYVYGLAAVLLAASIGYFLVIGKADRREERSDQPLVGEQKSDDEDAIV